MFARLTAWMTWDKRKQADKLETGTALSHQILSIKIHLLKILFIFAVSNWFTNCIYLFIRRWFGVNQYDFAFLKLRFFILGIPLLPRMWSVFPNKFNLGVFKARVTRLLLGKCASSLTTSSNPSGDIVIKPEPISNIKVRKVCN